ncbi:MAG: hypothetical protein KF690_01810 [Bacteroidetes bacterium]|nr:hypothetical protein [Bacteroidota bacterium]
MRQRQYRWSSWVFIGLFGLYAAGMPVLQHVCLRSGKTETIVFSARDICQQPEREDCCELPQAISPACCSKFQALPLASSTQEACSSTHSHNSTEGNCECCHTESTQVLLPCDAPVAYTQGLTAPPIALLQVFLGWHSLPVPAENATTRQIADSPDPPDGRSRLRLLTILRI